MAGLVSIYWILEVLTFLQSYHQNKIMYLLPFLGKLDFTIVNIMEISLDYPWAISWTICKDCNQSCIYWNQYFSYNSIKQRTYYYLWP